MKPLKLIISSFLLSAALTVCAATVPMSIHDDPSVKLVGMSQDEAFEYGRLAAHVVFDYIKAKLADANYADPTGQWTVFGAMAESNARVLKSSGLPSSVVDQFFAGWEAGSKEIRERAGRANSDRLTKHEWRSRAPNSQMIKVSGQIMCSKVALTTAVGSPNKTQTIGDKVYLYWRCLDGDIQVVAESLIYGADGLIVGNVNDY